MQDVNKIIDHLNNEWSKDAVLLRKRIAILLEENSRLKEEVERLKEENKAKNKAENKEEEEE